METGINVPMFKLLQAVNSGVTLSNHQLQLLHDYNFIVEVGGCISLSDAGKLYLNNISPRMMREPVKKIRASVQNLSEAGSNANTTSVRAAIYELAKQDHHVLEALFSGEANSANQRVLRAMIKVYKRAHTTGHRAGVGYAMAKRRT